MRIETVTSRLRTDSTCRLPNRVSYGDRLTCCDARCLTRCHLASVQIRVISSELAKPARATATPAVHVGVVTRGPLSEADLDRGKTWSQSTPMRSYASPAPYCQREALHRSGTDCPSGVRPPRLQRIALRGQIRHSDV